MAEIIETEIGQLSVKMTSDFKTLFVSGDNLAINSIKFSLNMDFSIKTGVAEPLGPANTLRHDWKDHKYRRSLSQASTKKASGIIKNRLNTRLHSDSTFLKSLRKQYLVNQIQILKKEYEVIQGRKNEIENTIEGYNNELNSL